MAAIELTGSLFTQRQADIRSGKFELVYYPWDDLVPDLLKGQVQVAAPIVVSGGTNSSPTFAADVHTPLPSRVVFAVRYKGTMPVPPGMPPVTYTELLCRTGVVHAENNFVPSRITVLDLVSPTGIDVASMSDMLRGGNVIVGVMPGVDGITVANNQLVCNIQMYGWIGSFSGNATLYFSLRPAKVPNPGRFLNLELEDAKGIGLTKGIFVNEARKKIVPGVQVALDEYISDAVKDNLGALDNLVSALTNDQARVRAHGVMLHDFRLAATITSSFYVCYAVA